MPWVQARSSGWVEGGGDTPPLSGLLYLGVGMERLWIVCSASIGSDDQKEEKWFLLLGTSSRWVLGTLSASTASGSQKEGVRQLRFPEHVGEEILHRVLLMWNLLSFRRVPEKTFLSISAMLSVVTERVKDQAV